MCANLYGPVEGKRHDSTMLARSRLLESLQQHSKAPDGSILCIYGDPGLPPTSATPSSIQRSTSERTTEELEQGYECSSSGHFLRIRQWGGGIYKKGPYYTECGEMIDGLLVTKGLVWYRI
jgi:hypothetical protein